MISKYWVFSDILEYGTFTQTYDAAYRIMQSIIKDGGIDAKIEKLK